MIRRQYVWILLISMLLAVLCLGPAMAAETKSAKDYEAYDLGEVVVSADKPVVKEVAITNTVTAEDIKATNSKTVAEALATTQGLTVTAGRKNETEREHSRFRSETGTGADRRRALL